MTTQERPSYHTAILAVSEAFAAHTLRVEREGETEDTFIAKCRQAGCLEVARQADVSWKLRRPTVAGGRYAPAEWQNFLADLRIYAAFGLLPTP